MGAGPQLLHVRMRGRDSAEAHRASSPLELLFDLTFVVAISSVTVQMAESILEGAAATAVVPFMMVFFAIWWAWINFTWFASAFDVDDALYRVFTLLQMAGVLVLAAGVPASFLHSDFLPITIGYLIMRVAMVAQWLRAGAEDLRWRRTAWKYAGGILVVQLGWVLRLLLPPEAGTVSFALLVLAELAVPVWAEWGARTTWHPGHIAERYSLFVIILLGEVVAAATLAMQHALASSGVTPQLITIGLAGLALLFGVWWLYFLEPAEEGLRRRPELAYFWGFGHYVLFAAIAAIGAGLEVAVDGAGHVPKIGLAATGAALAIPVAIVFASLYVLHRPIAREDGVPGRVLLPAAVLTLLVPLASPALGVAGTVIAIAVIAAVAVAATLALGARQRGADAGTLRSTDDSAASTSAS